jgi:hypothetical protein
VTTSGTSCRTRSFRETLSAILAERREGALPDEVRELVVKTTVEILTLRPTMSYGVSPARD